MFHCFNFALMLALCALLNAIPAEAKLQEFSVKTDKFKIELPADWDHLEEVLGVPVTLLSPAGPARNRTVIQITPYGVTDKDDVLKKIPKDSEEYVKQKEDWLERVDGQSLSFDSFQEESANGGTIYSVGLSYEIENGKFHQQTFYITDKNKRIYMISALTPLDLDDKSQATVKAVARSIASAK